MPEPIPLPLTPDEQDRLEPHFPLLNSIMDRLDEQERRVRQERLFLQEARRSPDRADRRSLDIGDDDPRVAVWDQVDSRQKKAGLYKLYLQNSPLGEIVDKIAKRFVSGKWSIIPRPTLPGVKRKTRGKVGDLLLLLDFFYNTNPDEDFNQLLYKYAQDTMLFGESYFEVDSLNGKPSAIYSLPTPYMDYVADKYNVVRHYTFGKSDATVSRPKKVDKSLVFRTWVPHLLNPLRGFALIEGMVNPLFSDQMMIKSQQSTFQNLPSSAPVYYELPPSSSASMARGLQVWMRENFTGVQNSGNERVLYGGATAKTLNLKPLDAEFLAGREANRSEIRGRMHVPDTFNDETSERNFRFDVLNFLKEMLLEKINYGIIQTRFGIYDWVLDLSFADYAADPYAERVKTVGEKRKEQQLEGETDYDNIPLIALETHAQDQKQRMGKASRTPEADSSVSRSKRLSRTAPGKGKNKTGADKPPTPPQKEA